MRLAGDNPLHRTLEAVYGPDDAQPADYSKDGRTPGRRAAWRCPACDDQVARYTLTVALDVGGDGPRCSRNCTEGAVWGALRRKRTNAPSGERTGVANPSKKSARSTAKCRDDENAHRDGAVSEDISKGVISKGVISKGVSEGTSLCAGVSRSGGVARNRNEARALALGIAADLDTDFACVLAGHQHRARLVSMKRGFWLYWCADHAQLSLAQVRAAVASGKVAPLSDALSSRWLERLDYEAGLRTPRRVSITLPDDCTAATARVGRGLSLFLGLRDESLWRDQPFSFARSFIVAYCGVTTDEARWAMGVLEREHVLVRVGVSGLSILWQLSERTA